MKIVGYQQPTCLCVKMISWLETFHFNVNCIHFHGTVFVHVGSAQLRTENGISFYMCSAVDVAWLTQNIPQSNTRIGGGTGGCMGLGPPLLFLGGPGPPLFCLNVVSLSNTISVGSSDKVNRSLKKTLQNFDSILSILFLTYYLQFGRIS